MAVAILLGAFPAPSPATPRGGSCADIKADCAKVRRLIREFWPATEEDHAIECFDDESSLYKWAGKNSGSQYKGVAQLSRAIRRTHEWSWRLKRQIRIAWQVWKWHRENKGSGWIPWYAPGC